MALKHTPDLQVLLYSGAGVPYPLSAPIIVNDVMSDSLVPGTGDGAGYDLATLNPNISGEWFSQPSYVSVSSTLQFCRFAEDGGVVFGSKNLPNTGKNDFAGWMLKPREAWLDCKIGANAGTIVDGGQTDQNFEVASGSSVWITTLAQEALHGNAICNAQGPATGAARTIGTIPKNRSLCFDLRFLGQSSNASRMDACLQWGGQSDGDTYSLYFSQGQAISLQKLVSVTQGNASTMQWRPLFSFTGIDVANLGSGRYRIHILRIAGRLVIDINGHTLWYAQTVIETPIIQETIVNGTNIIDVNWGTGKVSLTLNNCRCRMEMGVVKYSAANGSLFTGNFVKKIYRKEGVPEGTTVDYSTGGWKKSGARVVVAIGSSSVDFFYTTTLTANSDGIDTPFVSKVNIYKEATYTNPLLNVLDVSGALESVTVRQSLPTAYNNSGSTATIALDMMRLRGISADMLNYATKYRQIEIKARWQDSDGNSPAYTQLFQGWTTYFNDNLPGFGEHTRVLRARDAMVLIQEPAAFVDHRYPPGDVFFAKKGLGALSNINQVPNIDGTAFYDYDLIRELLRIEYGGRLADTMQVVFPPNHYPMIGIGADRCGYLNVEGALGNATPFENGFLFPPKYWSYLYQWLQEIMKIGRGTLFTSWPQNDRTDWPVLVYAKLDYYLLQAARRTWLAPDNIYVPDDLERMFSSLDIETRPESDFNHFYAGSSPPGTNLGGILPDMRLSEAYLMTGDNVAWKSWRRTLPIRSDIAWFGGAGVAGVDVLAQFTRNELEGVELEWPAIPIPGEPEIAPGDKMTIKRELGLTTSGARRNSYGSPAGLNGFENVTCRIQGIEHTFNCSNAPDARRWRTRVELRPLLSSGI